MAITLDQAFEELGIAEAAALERSRGLIAEGQAKLLLLTSRCSASDFAKQQAFRFELTDGGLAVLSARAVVATWRVDNSEVQLRRAGNEAVSYSTGDVDDAVRKTAEIVRVEVKKSLTSDADQTRTYARSA